MATVTGFTKERMLEIENTTITDGHIDVAGHLILETREGTEIDAGSAIGPTGPVDPAAKESFSGVVHPTWSGAEINCPVVLDAGQLDSGTKTAICDLNDQNLQPGVKVLVTRLGGAGGTWWVDRAFPAYPTYPKQILLTLQNDWALYNDIQDPSETYGSPKYQMGAFATNGSVSANSGPVYATMSRYGIVRVDGLIQRPAGNPTSGSIIATLPVGMRPSTEVLVNVLAGSGTAVVSVDVNGNIRYVSGVANTYFTLSNVRFRAKSAVDLGLATFTSILPYVTGFAAYTGTFYTGGSTSHTPGYTVDADGIVLFEGAMVATAGYTAGTIAGRLTGLSFNYPDASHQMVYVSTTPVGTFRFGTQVAAGLTGTQGINFNSTLVAGNWIALSHISLVDPAKTLLATPTNTWLYYSAAPGGWMRPRFFVTPDRQIFLQGLWTAGTIGQVMEKFTMGNWPRYSLLYATLTNGAAGRLDVRTNGDILPAAGSSVWYSLDGIDFVAYR